MIKYKKIGIVLILIGICIPLISFVFATGYNPHLGFWWSVTRMNINLWETYEESPTDKNIQQLKGKWVDVIEYSIPYKYPFSLGIIFILSGLGLFVLSKQKKIEE